jgi:hypothetical protein
MTSVLGICNSALAKVGCSPIAALDDGSREATLINSIFEAKRDEVMTAHAWNGCVRRETWTPLATAPAFEYDYEYAIPTDCLRVLSLEEDELFPDGGWAVEGRKLLSNFETVNARIVYRNLDASSWGPMFAEALAWRLAQEIAYALTQSSEREQKCKDSYEKALRDARSADGAEGGSKGLIVDTWTSARR